MRIENFGILLMAFSFTFFSCTNKCPKEDVAILKSKIKSNYLDWKESLDYLDHEVIQVAFIEMDSTLVSMQECHTLPDDFKLYVDSVSKIYTQYKYKEDDFRSANQLLEKIEGMLPD